MGDSRRRARLLALLLLALGALACATPAVRIDRTAAGYGLQREIVEGTDFQHTVYSKGGEPAAVLHVYLEGDGLPWVTETRIARDPTPRHAVALGLMELDSAPSLYLGRPCYHHVDVADPCHPLLWTHQRYGAEVVDSMASALETLLQKRYVERLVLIGYSGGGVLAMLLAERLEGTAAVVTIAANLDVEAWAAHHGYTPLAGSLNPAHRPPLPASIRQLHLVGGADARVPAALVHEAVAHQPAAVVLTYEDFDHTCCWARIWPEVLERLEEQEQ